MLPKTGGKMHFVKICIFCPMATAMASPFARLGKSSSLSLIPYIRFIPTASCVGVTIQRIANLKSIYNGITSPSRCRRSYLRLYKGYNVCPLRTASVRTRTRKNASTNRCPPAGDIRKSDRMGWSTARSDPKIGPSFWPKATRRLTSS